MKILIVEDERLIAETIADLLSAEGWEVTIALEGESGLDAALRHRFDAVILDVMLPKRDGFSVVSQLRKQGVETPVLMLTARTQLEDRVSGLDSGADYYLTKPFSGRELLACLRALTRRGQQRKELEEMSFGDLRLEVSTGELCCGGKNVRLSRKEFELLVTLMRSPDKPVVKELLMRQIWGGQSQSEETSVEVYISFLRKKLSYLGSGVTIRTIRMVGYQLEAET